MQSTETTEMPTLFSETAECHELYSRMATVEAVRRADLQITRQVTRGGVWYVVHDPLTFQHHRMSQSDYQVFVAVQAGRSLQQCFEELVRQQVLVAADSERFFAWVVRLNQLGLVSLPVDTGQTLHTRQQEKRMAARRLRLSGLLFYRMPLWSPDAFIRRIQPLTDPLFSRLALMLWAVGMVCCGVLVWHHRVELAHPFQDVSVGQSAALMAVLLTLLKVGHELGHACACRYFGGRVPEMGLFFIVFTPCAYVDASATWSFPSRRHRIAVALAGMYFESIAAMAAVMLWCLSEPSLIKAAAHQALLLATVVTIGFNLNPLMKFDGYYVLADLLGMPELRGDAVYEWQRLLKRVLYGVDIPTRATGRWQQVGLVLFGVAVSVYKVTVILGISLLVAGLPVVGLPVAVVFVLGFCWQQLLAWGRYTLFASELASCRLRAGLVAVGAVGMVTLALCLVPAPGEVLAGGPVVWETQHTIHAEADGVVGDLAVRPGDKVLRGQTLVQLQSDRLQHQGTELRAAAQQMRQRLTAHADRSPAELIQMQEQYRRILRQWRELQRRDQNLTVTAPGDGQVVSVTEDLVSGQWVPQGQAVLVLGQGRRVVQARLDATDVTGDLPESGTEVEVSLGHKPGCLVMGIVRHVSSVARSQDGASGETLTEPAAGLPGESSKRQFLVEVELPAQVSQKLPAAVTARVRLPAPTAGLGHTVLRSCCRIRDQLLMAH